MATPISETVPQYEVSYEEWLRDAPESRMSEWVKGRVIEFMPPTERHQDFLIWLATILNLLLRAENLGKIIPAPFEMKLDPIPSSREPDLLVVLNANLERLDGKRLNGPADLAVEIVSPDSVTRDRRDKLAEYASVGVTEYWIIDPRLGRYSCKAHLLNDEHVYEAIHAQADGRIASTVVPGFAFDPNWLEQDPLPDPLQTFLAMAPNALDQR